MSWSFLVHWPAFGNGFISDDYVILQRAAELPDNLFSLFQIPPECFRTTSYLTFGLLKWALRYHSGFFYAFAILLHGLNGFLLFRLLSALSKVGTFRAAPLREPVGESKPNSLPYTRASERGGHRSVFMRMCSRPVGQDASKSRTSRLYSSANPIKTNLMRVR